MNDEKVTRARLATSAIFWLYLCLGICVFSVLVAMWSLIDFLIQKMQRHEALGIDKIAVILGACAISYFLFLLRLHHRLIYGVVELCISVFLIWQTLSSAQPETARVIATFAAGCYLLVRAFDNIHEGSKQLREKLKAAIDQQAQNLT